MSRIPALQLQAVVPRCGQTSLAANEGHRLGGWITVEHRPQGPCRVCPHHARWNPLEPLLSLDRRRTLWPTYELQICTLRSIALPPRSRPRLSHIRRGRLAILRPTRFPLCRRQRPIQSTHASRTLRSTRRREAAAVAAPFGRPSQASNGRASWSDARRRSLEVGSSGSSRRLCA